jgi:hypothetical protein
VTCWLVPSAGQKIPIHPGWYLPTQKFPLAEKTGFFWQVMELKIQRKNRGSAIFTSLEHSPEEETELFANFRRYLIEYHLTQISSSIDRDYL